MISKSTVIEYPVDCLNVQTDMNKLKYFSDNFQFTATIMLLYSVVIDKISLLSLKHVLFRNNSTQI